MLVHAAANSHTGTAPDTRAVVLTTPSENGLLCLERRLLFEGINHHAFREPDPPYNGQLMAIGIAPANDSRIVRPLLKGFSLLGD